MKAFLYRDLIPHSGSWNMAVDEWLLHRAVEHNELALRFYTWEEPTLSLGFFQEKHQLELPEALKTLPRVRRLSGGGAILHDQELTYSVILPPQHVISLQPTALYGLVHNAFLAALGEQGVSAQMRGTEVAARNGQFLCFLRGDRHDVLIGEHKILGSAQRRRKGAILQHGSCVLRQSAHAAEVPGLEDLSGKTLDLPRLMDRIIQQLQPIHSLWTSGPAGTPEFTAELAPWLAKYDSK